MDGGYALSAALAFGDAGGKAKPSRAAFAWSFNQGQRFLTDGKPLESSEENITELEKMAAHLTTKRLPILEALKVI